MKNKLYFLVVLLGLSTLTYSCIEDLPTNYEFNGYEFAEMDLDAGDWNLILFPPMSR